ncbi:MAG: hypothetical protein AABN95_16100 [Acidobacteriota bacterium]
MGDISEVQQAKAWIYTVLAANSDIASACGTRIYDSYVPGAPASRTYPFVIFNFMGGNDINALGTSRLLSTPLFQVRVVCEGRPTATIRLVDKRISDVLGVAVYQLSGDWYFTARREQPLDRPELDAATGRQYHNLGGLFRLYIGRTV